MYTADRFYAPLSVLALVKSAQQQHGLRHGDYQRYRQYVSRKLRRMRKSLHFQQGTRSKVTPKKLTSDIVTDPRFITLRVFEIERSWAYAMQLKAESNTELRKRFQMISRLRKAVLRGNQLTDLAAELPMLDAKTKLEIQAYVQWVRGTLSFELQDWIKAKEFLESMQAIYTCLIQTIEEDARAIYTARVADILPQIHYCAYNIGDKSAASDLQRMRAEATTNFGGLAELQLDELLTQARASQAGQVTSVEWLGRSIPIKSEKAKMAVLAVNYLSFLLLCAFPSSDLSTVVAPDPPAFRSLFNLHDMSYGDDESFRVQLVATVLRNLAVDGGLSAVSISRDPQALRFIFLCIYLNHSSLRQLGLETLSSLHFPVVGTLVSVLKHLICTLMCSSDRNDRIRVHPIRYSIVPPTHPNAGSLSSTHPTTKNASPISTMPRVLPKLAETALSAASFPSPVICASPSSSASSCKKPRSEPVKLPTAIAPAGPTNSATMQSFSSSSPLVKSSRPLLSADSRTSRPVSLERPSPSDTALNAEATKCPLAPRLDINLRPALPRPGKLTGDSPVVQVPGSVRRAYMFDWLKRNYAVHNHSSVPRVQIYNDYQHAHQRRFGSSCGNAVSPVDFHSEIKSIFPGVEQVKVQTTHGNVEIHYNNLRCIHSPQPNSEKGVNDIMAAVLSPSKNELPSVRAPKVKLPKRAIGPLHPASTPGSPLGATVAESEPPIPLKLARLLPAHIVNGHLESATDTNNGRKLLPVNGLHKEVIHILNHSTSLAGGLQSITNGPRLSSPDTSGDPIKYKTSSSHCPRLNELVSSETGIVLLPVFTAFNLHAATSIANRSSPTPDSKVLTETCNLIVSSPSPILRDSYTPGSCTMAVANHCSPSSVLNSAESIKCVPDNSQLDLGCPIDPAPRPSSAETSSDLQMVTTPSPSFLICQWNACGRTFQRIDDVIAHVMDTHITKSNSEEVSCSWMDCSELLTNCSVDTLAVHILTRHLPQSDGSSHLCSSNSNLTCATSTERRPSSLSDLLQADCILADPSCVSTSASSLPSTADSPLVNELSGSSEPTLEDSSQSPLLSAPLDPTPVDPVLPGGAYPPSTTSPVGVALPSSSSCTVKLSSECRRALANSAPNHPFVSPPTREGPVTKHIRLTAALVLKNLVRYSPTARRYVAKWEELICDLAFSDLESSPTLFECLSYLDNGGGLLDSSDRHFFSLPMVPTVDFTRCTSSFSS
ncbi:unnamed protein product [Dicrocoelium dendriticum]|nr:unnamed protein product [Dicrocoelium dendriticum]